MNTPFRTTHELLSGSLTSHGGPVRLRTEGPDKSDERKLAIRPAEKRKGASPRGSSRACWTCPHGFSMARKWC